MAEEEEGQIGYCKNCSLEFSLSESCIRVIQEPAHGRALIIDSRGFAHSLLMEKSFEDFKRKMAAQDAGWSQPTQYQKIREEKEASRSGEEMLEELLNGVEDTEPVEADLEKVSDVEQEQE